MANISTKIKKTGALITVYFGHKQYKTFQIAYDEQELEHFRQWAHENCIYYAISRPDLS